MANRERDPNLNREALAALPLLADADARYIVRPPHRDWGLYHELLLLPILLACESDFDYLECSAVFCTRAGREPRWHSEVEPAVTKPMSKKETQALIERHTVTKTLVDKDAVYIQRDAEGRIIREEARGSHEIHTALELLSTGSRTGQPLTWAEKVYFLQCHARKKYTPHQYKACSIEELLRVLDRGASDRDAITTYLGKTDRMMAEQGRTNPRGMTEREDRSRPSILSRGRYGTVREAATAFVRSLGKPAEVSRSAFRSVHMACLQAEPKSAYSVSLGESHARSPARPKAQVPRPADSRG